MCSIKFDRISRDKYTFNDSHSLWSKSKNRRRIINQPVKCNQARSKRCTSRLNNWQTASSHARFETQTRQVEDATTVQFEDAHKGAKFATDNVVSGTRSETLGLSRRRSNEPELPDSSNWLLISHNYDAVVVCRERERESIHENSFLRWRWELFRSGEIIAIGARPLFQSVLRSRKEIGGRERETP